MPKIRPCGQRVRRREHVPSAAVVPRREAERREQGLVEGQGVRDRCDTQVDVTERVAARGAHAFVPSDAQTSIFVRTREMTSSVNSVVDAWPPRSGVRTPDAVASSTLS